MGDMVKACFPVSGLGAGALWRDDEDEPIMALEGRNGLLHGIICLGAVDGDAPQPAHDGAGWPFEEGVLAHPENFDPKS